MNEVDAYLSLGSNLGDRMGYLKRGIDSLSKMGGVEIDKMSGVYETDPLGVTDQPEFLNMAVTVKTSLGPRELLTELKRIETDLGRIHRQRWREREIDMDIVFYSDMIVNARDLTIPHESAHLRRFVLQPMSDIAPRFVHPVLKKTVAELLAECPDKSAVRRVEGLFSRA